MFNKIGPDGGKAAGEALKTNTTLESLDLGFKIQYKKKLILDNYIIYKFYVANEIGNSSARVIGEALKTNNTLKELYLIT